MRDDGVRSLAGSSYASKIIIFTSSEVTRRALVGQLIIWSNSSNLMMTNMYMGRKNLGAYLNSENNSNKGGKKRESSNKNCNSCEEGVFVRELKLRLKTQYLLTKFFIIPL